MLLFHLAAIAALFTFSWANLAVAAVLYWIAGGLGVCMCYHRLLTHRSFRTPRLVERALAVCGTLALQGGPISWVGVHRLHHQKSDQPGDPHTPREGGFWAHMGWILYGEALHNDTQRMARYTPDLARDRFYLWLSTYHYVPQIALSLILLAAGGWTMVLWGIGLRVTLGLHATWLVNSATHMWGTRRFATRDDSRNNWWVALLTFGEGWHNNHHAHPTSARHGLVWNELDITWLQIRALQFLGLAKSVRLPAGSIPPQPVQA